MKFVFLSGLVLLLAGHLLRRATPALVGLRERALPFTWPFLELLAGGLGLLLGRAFGATQSFGLLVLLSFFLLAACATDYLVKLIPDRITLGGSALGIALAPIFPELILGQPFGDVFLAGWGFELSRPAAAALLALVGALLGFALLEVLRRLSSLAAGIETMGMGDSKLLMLVGAFLGPFGAVATLGLSFLLGVVHGAAAALITRQPHAPFGPAIAAAAWLYLLGPGSLLTLWDRFQAFILALPAAWLFAFYAALLLCVLLLVLRVRRRAAEYEAIIEADYRDIDGRLEDPEGDVATDENKDE